MRLTVSSHQLGRGARQHGLPRQLVGDAQAQPEQEQRVVDIAPTFTMLLDRWSSSIVSSASAVTDACGTGSALGAGIRGVEEGIVSSSIPG